MFTEGCLQEYRVESILQIRDGKLYGTGYKNTGFAPESKDKVLVELDLESGVGTKMSIPCEEYTALFVTDSTVYLLE